MRFETDSKLLTQRLGGLLVCLATTLSLTACEQPPVFQSGTPATYEGMEFTLLPYDLEILELETDNGTAKYAKPLLVIPLKIKNVSGKPFLYNPVHQSQKMTEETTPLLYVEPKGEDVKLPPENKTIINGAYLEKGRRPKQLTERTTIAPNEEITDYFLFEDPGKESADLIFSIPPIMTTGKLPVLFKFNYTPQLPKGPKTYDVGESIKLGNAEFSITGHKIQYVEITDAQRGKGYTSQPLLKIDFVVKNIGDKPFTYTPDHRIVGTQGPGLFGVSQTIGRVRLQPTTQAYKQQNAPLVVEPGSSITDYLLFVPPAQAGDYKLEVPGTLFEQPGRARVMLNVQPSNPSLPDELESEKDESHDDATEDDGADEEESE